MNDDKIKEVCSLAAEFIQELKELPVDDYLEIELTLLAVAPTSGAKKFLQVVFELSESQGPLLIGTREGAL